MWNAATPIGASSTDTREVQSRRRRMATNEATAHMAMRAMPFGRQAVPTAAARPASTHRSSSSSNMATMATTMNSGSAYENDSTNEPGKMANSIIARLATSTSKSR